MTEGDYVRWKITKEVSEDGMKYYANIYNRTDKNRMFLLDTYKHKYSAKTKNKLWNILKDKHNFNKHYCRKDIWITEM